MLAATNQPDVLDKALLRPGGGEKPISEETARIVDSEVLRIIGECHQEARRLLTKHRGELEALAPRALLDAGSGRRKR